MSEEIDNPLRQDNGGEPITPEDSFQIANNNILESAHLEDRAKGINLMINSKYYTALDLMEYLLIARDKIISTSNGNHKGTLGVG
jgi:hypothetical protein